MARKISLQASDLSANDVAKMRDCTFKDTSGTDKTVKVLATADMSIGGGSGLPTGTADHMLLRWDASESKWVQIGGYNEVEVILYTRDSVLNGTILFKPSEEGGVTGYASSQDRLLLQVVDQSTETVLILDHGHLADGGT